MAFMSDDFITTIVNGTTFLLGRDHAGASRLILGSFEIFLAPKKPDTRDADFPPATPTFGHNAYGQHSGGRILNNIKKLDTNIKSL
ncbi:uncharacterized protein H6S33_005029 [Morchella sextelata]|uniref:uncharacterized protein n=1 Tax=Morchella sextelata TaxID=1174677 RepID=UPI001D03ABE8|nr:uncharacterized protein H6S33_005029 [Morchella sextelata]KAH0605047.1 hypothetical protein H6S33_005029 [Morchella sextelata]